MKTILEKITEQKKRDLLKLKKEVSLSELQKQVEKLDISHNKNSFHKNLEKSTLENISIIAEIKRHSPSKGDLRPDLDPIDLAGEYIYSGASAISVLTEEKFFHGKTEDLKQIKANYQIPVLRKDFIVDEYQIWESKIFGANAILLIAACLSDQELKSFYKLAIDLNLDVLFEAHTQEETQRILELEPKILGINNRNLHTFEVSLDTSLEIIEKYKKSEENIIWVSESGIYTRKNIEDLFAVGFKAFLIGESLLKADKPQDKLKELLSI